LEEFPNAVLATGEGEEIFYALATRPWPPETVAGVAWRQGGALRATPPGPPPALDALPFPYGEGLAGLAHKILYYETARGCPFRCGFCMSGVGPAEATGAVRFLSPARWRGDLDFFLKNKIPQVKFVDRTFNWDPARARAIWAYLMARDNGVTNFHFELSASLLDEETFRLLKEARPGLFQFEIGVQSTNPEALAAVGRAAAPLEAVARLGALGGVHLHVDLIAGLPGETYGSFGRSFDAVYATGAEQIQLGFLKVLRGTRLRAGAGALGLRYAPDPPYEVLGTDALPYGDLLKLKKIEKLLNMYHAGGFPRALAYLVCFFPGPFAFYEGMAEYWTERELFEVSHSQGRLYEILRAFALEALPAAEAAEDFIRFDLCRAGLPGWGPPRQQEGEASRRCRKREAARRGVPLRGLRVEPFAFDVLGWTPAQGQACPRRAHWVLFDPGRGVAEEVALKTEKP
jgi:hypothetical protein